MEIQNGGKSVKKNSSQQIANEEQILLSSNKDLQKTQSRVNESSPPSSPPSISSDYSDAGETLRSPSEKFREAEQRHLKLMHDSVGSQRQAPAIQIMGKPENFDPNRIPSTVFTRDKSQSPMDWSVASNESLFSLHMGNSSFSRDHAFILGKSGELGAFPLDLHTNPIPEVSDLDDAGTSELEDHVYGDSGVDLQEAERSLKQVIMTGRQQGNNAQHSGEQQRQHKAAASPPPLMSPRPSDGSSSTQSFAFPVLTTEEIKSRPIRVKKEESTPTPMPTPEPIPSQQTSWFHQVLCCSTC